MYKSDISRTYKNIENRTYRFGVYADGCFNRGLEKFSEDYLKPLETRRNPSV